MLAISGNLTLDSNRRLEEWTPFFPWWLLAGQDDRRLLHEGTLLERGQRQLGDLARYSAPSDPHSACVPCAWHLMALVSSASDVNVVLIFHSSVTP